MQPAIYIMASGRNGTSYIGVTSDLIRRVYQHRTSALPGFTSRHVCKMPVHYQLHPDMTAAITREKPLEGGSRTRKLTLIEAANPTWQDLYEQLI